MLQAHHSLFKCMVVIFVVLIKYLPSPSVRESTSSINVISNIHFLFVLRICLLIQLFDKVSSLTYSEGKYFIYQPFTTYIYFGAWSPTFPLQLSPSPSLPIIHYYAVLQIAHMHSAKDRKGLPVLICFSTGPHVIDRCFKLLSYVLCSYRPRERVFSAQYVW